MSEPTSEPNPDGRIGFPFSSRSIWVGSAGLTAALFALSWPKYADHSYWAESIPLEILYGIVAYLMAVYVMVVFIRSMQERTLEEA